MTGRWIKPIQIVFGVLLILIGVLVFVSQLSRVANIKALVDLFGPIGGSIGGADVMSLSILNLSISFVAGLVSFLSPCVLPLIPGFLTYLASISLNKPAAAPAQADKRDVPPEATHEHPAKGHDKPKKHPEPVEKGGKEDEE